MPKRSSKPGPRDLNEMAADIVAKATGSPSAAPAAPPGVDGGKDPAAVELGRKGGKKGGKARAAKLTAPQRSEAARKAAQARWHRP